MALSGRECNCQDHGCIQSSNARCARAPSWRSACWAPTSRRRPPAIPASRMFRPATRRCSSTCLRPAIRACAGSTRSAARWPRSPATSRVAVALANAYLDYGRDTGDARYLGRAQAVIAPWLAKRPAPVDALLVSATILQSRHQFAESRRVLQAILQARSRQRAGLADAVVRGAGTRRHARSATRLRAPARTVPTHWSPPVASRHAPR